MSWWPSKKGPCYECNKRYPGCSDHCEIHKEYFAKLHEAEQKLRDEKFLSWSWDAKRGRWIRRE